MPRKTAKKGEIQFRLHLVGAMARKFNTIKNRLGLKSNSEVVRQLISLEYEKITSERN